eukprot:TRINITY_DN60558_c0_g1_i1.p1 TRINITY_DN60558_c0_g1~~TRINITY_DN60558_c0_g1_i1.p1  ORF type:complete len:570 (-),score=52.82 TRINITY_DN60558_c0_g1_i1:21-1730(-)
MESQAVLDGIPLTQEQTECFIVNGFLHLPPSPDMSAVHNQIRTRATELGAAKCQNLGNNILPALPELTEVFSTETMRGALTSLLGPAYAMHPHRFCHATEDGTARQTWHRDSFWGHWHARSHVPYWLMAIYFPQKTVLSMGPTGVLARTQYLNKDGNQTAPFGVSRLSDKETDLVTAWGSEEEFLKCEAGSVFLMHYDLWHRGSANTSNDSHGVRFMFKFQFLRTVSPSLAFPCHAGLSDWGAYLAKRAHCDLSPVWESVWQSLQGVTSQAVRRTASGELVLSQKPEDCLAELEAGTRSGEAAREPGRIALAYSTAAAAYDPGQFAALLVDWLAQPMENFRARACMYALRALGSAACPPLLDRMDVLQCSAFPAAALAQCLDVESDEVIHRRALGVLSELMRSEDKNVRQATAEALGSLRCNRAAEVAVASAQCDTDGDVRASCCYAVLRLVSNGSCKDPDERGIVWEAMLEMEQRDADRYVTAYAAEVLHRLDHDMDFAVDGSSAEFPILVRWCTKGNGWTAREGTGRVCHFNANQSKLRLPCRGSRAHNKNWSKSSTTSNKPRRGGR